MGYRHRSPGDRRALCRAAVLPRPGSEGDQACRAARDPDLQGPDPQRDGAGVAGSPRRQQPPDRDLRHHAGGSDRLLRERQDRHARHRPHGRRGGALLPRPRPLTHHAPLALLDHDGAVPVSPRGQGQQRVSSGPGEPDPRRDAGRQRIRDGRRRLGRRPGRAVRHRPGVRRVRRRDDGVQGAGPEEDRPARRRPDHRPGRGLAPQARR